MIPGIGKGITGLERALSLLEQTVSMCQIGGKMLILTDDGTILEEWRRALG
jgi:hypothetical protein